MSWIRCARKCRYGRIEKTVCGGTIYIMLAVFAMACTSTRSSQAEGSLFKGSKKGTSVELCGSQGCQGKSARIKNIKVLQQSGARPRWSPKGDLIVFDRRNGDGYYDVYLSDLKGNIVGSLTDGKAGIGQKHNGNADFHPSGNYIVFVSEEEEHTAWVTKWHSDPGIGMVSNLWATTPAGDRFWKLTDIPIKMKLRDKIPVMGVVNPHFSRDGAFLEWSERYDAGGHHNWGKWRLMKARFSIENNQVSLKDEHVLYTPSRGNYVTSMGFLGKDKILVAGNLDGQHEYGMDQYVLNLETGKAENLQNSPDSWEEGACISPSGRSIVFMTNVMSGYKLDFDNAKWAKQPRQRDYYIMDINGENRERLTYFNDPTAPEYVGRRVIVAACDISPDGKFLAGTFGVDFGNDRKAKIDLKVVLIEFEQPIQ